MAETTTYYMQFVEALDASLHEVSDWEATFLAGILENPPASFSPKQIATIQRMGEKHLGETIK